MATGFRRFAGPAARRIAAGIVLAGLAIVAASPAFAQVSGGVLKAGTQVQLRFEDDVSSQTAAAGQLVHLVVDSDVRASGRLAVAAGTPVRARVLRAQPGGSNGRAGTLLLGLEAIELPGREIRMYGNVGSAAPNHEGAAAIVTGLLGPLAALAVRGGKVEIPRGTIVLGHVDENVELDALPHPGADVAPALSPATP